MEEWASTVLCLAAVFASRSLLRKLRLGGRSAAWPQDKLDDVEDRYVCFFLITVACLSSYACGHRAPSKAWSGAFPKLAPASILFPTAIGSGTESAEATLNVEKRTARRHKHRSTFPFHVAMPAQAVESSTACFVLK